MLCCRFSFLRNDKLWRDICSGLYHLGCPAIKYDNQTDTKKRSVHFWLGLVYWSLISKKWYHASVYLFLSLFWFNRSLASTSHRFGGWLGSLPTVSKQYRVTTLHELSMSIRYLLRRGIMTRMEKNYNQTGQDIVWIIEGHNSWSDLHH